MARKSKIARNEQRIVLVEKYKQVREELNTILKSGSSSDEEKDSSPVRIRNRCMLTGRSRGYYRKFGLCRLELRRKALSGELPGVTKASW
ncbi:UNVERIFIED_CONTAM: hypothetical protein GTU68_063284 [Idotea baltica]|nr:hypothetical protein [Idotea baltica]